VVRERHEHEPAGRRQDVERAPDHGGHAGRLDQHPDAVAAGPVAQLVGHRGRVAADDGVGAQRPRVLEALGHDVGHEHRGAAVARGETGGQADRPGPEHDRAIVGADPRPHHRAHADRGRLDEGGHGRRQVSDGEDLRGRDAQALL
jgi:hypothetical protein